jgi:hypothetical protein
MNIKLLSKLLRDMIGKGLIITQNASDEKHILKVHRNEKDRYAGLSPTTDSIKTAAK